MKVNVSVTLEENLRNRVAERAAVEERSFSAMFALLAQRGLDGPAEAKIPWPVTDFAVAASESVSAPPVFDMPAEPVPSKRVSKRDARTGLCEHRNPPTAYCSFCDG